MHMFLMEFDRWTDMTYLFLREGRKAYFNFFSLQHSDFKMFQSSSLTLEDAKITCEFERRAAKTCPWQSTDKNWFFSQSLKKVPSTMLLRRFRCWAHCATAKWTTLWRPYQRCRGRYQKLSTWGVEIDNVFCEQFFYAMTTATIMTNWVNWAGLGAGAWAQERLGSWNCPWEASRSVSRMVHSPSS